MNNINETVLLVAAIQGFLLFIALISKKTSQKLSSIAISLIVFVVTLTVLFSWGSATNYNNSADAIPFWVLQSNLIIPASFWLFCEVNTNPMFTFSLKYLLLFLPAFLDILVQTTFKVFPLLNQSQLYISFAKSDFWFFFVEILPLIATIIILIHFAFKLWRIKQKFNVSVKSMLSSYFRKMIFILALMGFLLAAWSASTAYLVNFKIIEIILVSFIFLLGYVAYFKPDFFEIPTEVLLKSENPFPNFNDKEELQKLSTIFKNKKPYLKPKLAIAELANELNLPPKYVSYIISTYHSKNFNDYINGYRVEEVINRIADPAEKHKSLLGIALDSGFNSKSSFNQVFKQYTGKTPSEYLE